jgi:lactam utilization protein B
MSEHEELHELAEMPIFALSRLSAFHEFMKDTYKAHLEHTYEEDEELQNMIQEALEEKREGEAMIRSANAKLVRAAARFGVELKTGKPPLENPIIQRLIDKVFEAI